MLQRFKKWSPAQRGSLIVLVVSLVAAAGFATYQQLRDYSGLVSIYQAPIYGAEPLNADFVKYKNNTPKGVSLYTQNDDVNFVDEVNNSDVPALYDGVSYQYYVDVKCRESEDGTSDAKEAKEISGSIIRTEVDGLKTTTYNFKYNPSRTNERINELRNKEIYLTDLSYKKRKKAPSLGTSKCTLAYRNMNSLLYYETRIDFNYPDKEIVISLIITLLSVISIITDKLRTRFILWVKTGDY